MPGRVEHPSLPSGAIELANLGTRPTFARKPSDESVPLGGPPLHVRRALSDQTPNRPPRAWPRHPSTYRTPSPLSNEVFASPVDSLSELPFAYMPSPRRTSIVHVPKFLGRPTAYRPAYLLGLGTAGASLFGIGTTILQKALWPAVAYAGLDPDGDTVIPAGTPGTGVVTGSKHGDTALGAVMVAVGVTASIVGSSLFFSDAVRLARRQQPDKPNLARPRAYFAAHLTGLSFLIASRFFAEALRKSLPGNKTWLLSMPAALGTAIFAVTQAQSFSSCELYNGNLPLKHRTLISQVARSGVSLWVLLGAMAGTPNMSSYLREGIKLAAQTSTALAFSLPLTEARIMERDHPTRPVIGPVRFRGDLTAMQSFGFYSLARFLSAVSAAILEYAQFPVEKTKTPSPAYENAAGWRGLPPPLPTGAPLKIFVPEAIALLTMATGLGAYAFWHLRKDAMPRGKCYANAMFAGALICLILGQAYRVLTENSKTHANFRELWFAMPIGVTANALAYVVLPELISQAEITQGNPALAHRYQVMEACRFTGTWAWALWVSLSSIQFVPPLVRQGIAAAASLLTILAMALPDATTRSRQTGYYTPAVERPSFN